MKRIIPILLFSFICASCAITDELLPPIEIGSPVTFSSSMADGSPLASSTPGAGTRVSGTSWHAMDSVGIYMYPSDNSLAASTYSNKLYFAPAGGSTVNLIPDSESETIYYPLDALETVKFTAYYPYTETVNNHTLPIDLSDQRTLLKHIRTDLLWHQGSTAYSGTSSAVNLTFVHQFSKVTMRLVPSASLVGVDLSSTTATLAGTPTTGSFSLATGVLSNLSDADNAIRTYRKAAVAGEATFEAIVLPHAGTAYGSRTANFTVNGKAYAYDISDSQTFLPGHHYTFEFALTTTGLILINNSITDWVEGVVTSPAPGANSYIVAPGGDWTLIPISRAKYYSDMYDKTHPVIESGETFYADIVWEDATSVVQDMEVVGTGPNGFIKVFSGNTPGNAIVALKKKVGDSYEILWSWHIWVVDYNPRIDGATWTANGSNVSNPRRTFMDRNLGATDNTLSEESRGLFYQWGRKDPFPRTNAQLGKGFSIAENGKVSITTTIQNPGVFNTVSYGDWNDKPDMDIYLWATVDDKKTIYDPCPSGWRVPTSGASKISPWYGLPTPTFESGGLSWDTNSNWPTTGARDKSSGTLYSANSYGFYWSATAQYFSGNYCYGYSFQFYNNGVYLNNGTFPSGGHSVRCVKE